MQLKVESEDRQSAERKALLQLLDENAMTSQRCFDFACGAISGSQPDDVWRKAEQRSQVAIVGVFGDDDEIVFSRKLPNSDVVGAVEIEKTDVRRSGKFVRQMRHELRRKVLIEKQFHETQVVKVAPSRCATKLRAAKISSRVRYGKSSKISSVVIPAARYDKIS